MYEIFELIGLDENCLEAINEANVFSTIIEKIKEFFKNLIAKLRRFISNFRHNAKEYIASEKNFIDKNKDAIFNGYGVFKQSKSKIRGYNYHVLVHDIGEGVKKFPKSDFFSMAQKDIDRISSNTGRIAKTMILSVEPEEMYSRIAQCVTRTGNSSIEYRKIKDELDKSYNPVIMDLSLVYTPQNILTMVNQLDTRSDEIYNHYVDLLKLLEGSLKDLNNLHLTATDPKFNAHLEVAKQVISRANVLTTDYISIVNVSYEKYRYLVDKQKHYAKIISKKYIEYDKMDNIPSNTTIDLESAQQESVIMDGVSFYKF